MFIDGFKYWLAYTKNNKKYYRCSRSKSSKCPGKLIMEGDKILTTIDHDHKKETRNNIVEKFRKSLTKKAIEKPNKSLVDIYLEETQNHSEASILYTFSQAESTMRKARVKKGCEKVEKIKEIESAKNFQHLRYFYCDEIEGGITVVLMNQATMKVVGKIEEIHVDCRIRIEGNFIVTVLGVQKGRDCALGFAIIPSSSINFTTLISFFSYLNHKMSSILIPSTILTSPNDLLQGSLRSSYPEASIKVMYFYYAHSILSRIHKNYKKSVFHLSSLKMILAIPLIPTNYVIPGWEALRKWMKEKNVDLNAICDLIYSEWLSEDVERISIFNGLAHSVNNYTQHLNVDLLAISSDNKNLTEKIIKIASKSFLKFTKSAKKVQKLQKVVKFATKSWISSPFHLRRPIQFLQQVSHCIDDSMIHFVSNYCDEEEKKVENDKNVSEPPPLVYFKDIERVVGVEPPPLIGIYKKN